MDNLNFKLKYLNIVRRWKLIFGRVGFFLFFEMVVNVMVDCPFAEKSIMEFKLEKDLGL